MHSISPHSYNHVAFQNLLNPMYFATDFLFVSMDLTVSYRLEECHDEERGKRDYRYKRRVDRCQSHRIPVQIGAREVCTILDVKDSSTKAASPSVAAGVCHTCCAATGRKSGASSSQPVTRRTLQHIIVPVHRSPGLLPMRQLTHPRDATAGTKSGATTNHVQDLQRTHVPGHGRQVATRSRQELHAAALLLSQFR
jgi:hypothetical protein